MKIRKGDTVQVVAGKDKGKKGSVLAAYPKLSSVLVEGVNIIKRSERARTANAKGQVVEKPAPVHVSNVMLIDPKTKKPTRVSIRKNAGKSVRVAQKSGSEIK
ncbi:MAG: 50S ribosomal protein L24 [Minisyncoccia bacterium]